MFVFIIRIKISHTSTVPLLVNNTGYNNIAYGKTFNLTQTGFKITCQVVVCRQLQGKRKMLSSKRVSLCTLAHVDTFIVN